MTAGIRITRTVVGPFRVNAYLVGCARTAQAVIIDPGGDPELLVAAVRNEGLKPIRILNTHGHADHIAANRDLASAFSVPVSIHEADEAFFGNPETRKRSAAELGVEPVEPTATGLRDGQEIEVGDLRLQVLHTPGHTPGSCCFLVEGNLFTGDTLFVGDVGRTDLLGGSFETLLDSLREKVITLPPTTVVWPGHDYGETPTSTLAWEIKENPYIAEFILG